MYKTILVPLDGSQRAEAVLPHVESLAQRNKAKVIFLGVVTPFVMGHEAIYPIFDEEIYKRQIDEMRAYLTARQEEFLHKDIDAHIRVGHKYVVDQILETARRENADLIAMASHGRTGLSGVFYGSVAAGVLHQVDRPLLLIRSGDEQ